MVRHISEDAYIQAGCPVCHRAWIEVSVGIARGGGADSDVMSPEGKAARHRGRNPGNAAVSPGVFEVGNNVQNPERRHGGAGAV